MHLYQTQKNPSILDNILILSTFFPWLSMGLNDFDSQPWSIVVGIIYILFRGNFFVNVYLFIFCVLTIFLILFLITMGDGFAVVRASVGYGAVVVVAYSFYIITKLNINVFNLLVLINILWLVAGLSQIFINPYVFDFLVPVRTSDTRGVTGLSPEPTFYALFLIFMSWFVLIKAVTTNNYFVAKLFSCINIIFVVFVAKSSMGVLLVVLIYLFWLLIFVRVKYLIILFVGLSFALIFARFFENLFDGSRLYNVAMLFVTDPLNLLNTDDSINQRLSHVYYSFSGFFDNYFMPYGVGHFGDYASNLSGGLSGLFHFLPGEKIMSWSGAYIFEGGFIGFAILIVIYLLMWNYKFAKRSLFSTVAFFLLSASAIPHGFAPLAALIGIYGAKNIMSHKFNSTQF